MTGLVAAVAVAAAVLVARADPGRAAAMRLHLLVGSARPAETVGPRRRARLVPAVVLAAAACAGAPRVAVPVAAAAAAVTVAVRRQRIRRLTEARRAATVELVYALAAELRAGRPPAAALASAATGAGTLAADVAAAAAATGAGGETAAELDRLARLAGCEGLRGVAAAWRVTEQAGGPIAEVLDRLGSALDAAERQRQVLAVAAAGPKATGWLLAVLPVLGVVLGESAGANPLGLLLHRPVGWLLLAGAGLLDAAGLGWLARLSRVPLP